MAETETADPYAELSEDEEGAVVGRLTHSIQNEPGDVRDVALDYALAVKAKVDLLTANGEEVSEYLAAEAEATAGDLPKEAPKKAEPKTAAKAEPEKAEPEKSESKPAPAPKPVATKRAAPHK